MKKVNLALFALLALVWSAFGQSGGDSKAALDSCDQMVDQGKYLSAYRLLDAVKNPDDAVLARKIDICFRYFAQSIGHRMFGLVDLAPGQSLDELRKAGGTFTLISLDPEEAVKDYVAKRGKSGTLYRELGEYYYDVLAHYQGNWFENDDEIVRRAIENYKLASDMGSLNDSAALDDYAELLLRSGRSADAVSAYKKSLALDGTNGNTHYNLAYAYLQMGNPKAALSEVKLAMDSYRDNPSFLFDADLMASDAAKANGDLDGALDWLAAAGKIGQGDYRLLKKEIPIDLLKGNVDAAAKTADALFAMAPENPAATQMVMQGYYEAKRFKELAAFFERALGAYKADSEASGNLWYHYASLAHDLGDDKTARARLDAAEAAFKAKRRPGDEIFETIAKERKAFGG